jgi:hypothetical protein
MHEIGFRNIHARYFEINLRLSYDVAVHQLKQWRIDSRFAVEHEKDLLNCGLEFPLEHVVACEELLVTTEDLFSDFSHADQREYSANDG